MKVFTIVLMFFLAACSDETAKNSDETKSDEPQPHILSDQEKMLQKAKDAEKLIKEAEKKRRQKIDDQG